MRFIAIVLGLVCGLLIVLASMAKAHQAPSGVQYLPECCNLQDCGVVSDHAVEELGGGHVRMTFKPGSHPMWGLNRTHDLIIDFEPKHRRNPIDGDWHGCFDPSQKALCYHPPNRGT